MDGPDSVLGVDIIHKTTRGYNQECWIAHSILFGFDYHDVLIMRHKNEIGPWIYSQIAFYARQWGIIIQKIQIDGETSLTQAFFDKIAEDGFDWLSTAPDSWEQHGRTDRAGGLLSKMQRTLRIESQLPENLHPELWSSAAYLLNRLPLESTGTSPLQMINEWRGKSDEEAKPQITHIKALDRQVYLMHKKVPKGRKSLPRAHIGYLTGFDATNIYHVWVPHLKRIFRARNVQIDETVKFDPANPHLDPLMITEVDDLIRLIEIPDLPDEAQTDSNY